ncbi:hypothetical protein CB1_000707003 [Camelus ferus]|nr:hypothetical protein CB1_000707003 [Camelus ferus]
MDIQTARHGAGALQEPSSSGTAPGTKARRRIPTKQIWAKARRATLRHHGGRTAAGMMNHETEVLPVRGGDGISDTPRVLDSVASIHVPELKQPRLFTRKRLRLRDTSPDITGHHPTANSYLLPMSRHTTVYSQLERGFKSFSITSSDTPKHQVPVSPPGDFSTAPPPGLDTGARPESPFPEHNQPVHHSCWEYRKEQGNSDPAGTNQRHKETDFTVLGSEDSDAKLLLQELPGRMPGKDAQAGCRVRPGPQRRCRKGVYRKRGS